MPAQQPRLSYVVGRLDRALRRRLADVLRPHGLTVRQYTTLSVLSARAGLSNAQLARRSLMTPQSMNEVLGGLVARGLVERRADESHGRIIRTRLTPAGASLLAACDRAVDALEDDLLAGLGAAERAGLQRALRGCLAALGAGIQDE